MSDTTRSLILVKEPLIEQMRNPLAADWNRPPAGGGPPSEDDADLAALIDFAPLDAIFADFLEVTGLPVAIIDLQARVLVSSKWQRLCVEFHRDNRGTLARCLESDISLSRQMQEGKPMAIYRCHNGLTDCAAPIIIDGRHVANLFIGQFFVQPPDLTFFRRQQEGFGFDPAAYLEAVAEVPIVAEAKLPAILHLGAGLARQIADLSLARLRALRAQAEVERQVAERTRQLSDSEARFHALFDGAIDGILVADLGTQRFVAANPALCRMLGYSAEELCGLGLSDIHPAASLPQVRAQFGRQARGEIITAANLPVQAKDGRVFTVDINAFALAWDGRPCLAGFFRDTTERRRGEELERYSAFQAGIAEMATTVLHNIGNAITTVTNNAEALLRASQDLGRVATLLERSAQEASDRLAQADSPQAEAERLVAIQLTAAKAIEQLHRDALDERCRRIAASVEHIADIVRIQQAVAFPSASASTFDLGQVIHDALAMQDDTLRQHDIYVEVGIDPGLGAVTLSRNRLLQALLNLVKNAYEAICARQQRAEPEGHFAGHIRVEARALRGGRLRLAVSDNGVGVSPEQRPGIFRYGYSTKERGSGFGLHATANFVQECGGSIRLESPGPDQGATLILELPGACPTPISATRPR